VKASVVFWTCLFFANMSLCFSNQDPLPSWNEGAVKQALLQFVLKTTNRNEKDFVPPEERIATFDQDGTLWVEHPLYPQLVFAIDRIKDLSSEHPEWKKEEPFRSILEGKVKQFSIQDIEKIVSASHSGLSVREFEEIVQDWLKTAKHPRFHRPYTELIYQPMLELIRFLQSNGYRVYIVSGGGQDFIRSYSNQVYGIPPEQIIGSAGKTRYEYRGGNPELIKQPQILLIDDKAGKPESIHLFIGKRPVAAFGNSDGDKEMLEWSQQKGGSLQLLVHHDDPEREYVYDADTKIGAFSKALMEEAKQKGWIVVSMKNDWKTIFSH